MVVGAKVCDLTEDLLWFVCGLYVGISTSSLNICLSWYSMNRLSCHLWNDELCLNNSLDVEKLQKLQNRCLRMCFDINNPRDISIVQLHERARLSILESDVILIC